MAKIKMYYNVPDVEHMGDVNYEENQLRKMGATIIDTDVTWGDDEIEEATITIEIDKKDKVLFEDYGCYTY